MVKTIPTKEELMKVWGQYQKRKSYMKKYRQKPYVKAKHKILMKEYNERPYVKEKKRVWIKNYHLKDNSQNTIKKKK